MATEAPKRASFLWDLGLCLIVNLSLILTTLSDW
jgi:hypothetical protein